MLTEISMESSNDSLLNNDELTDEVQLLDNMNSIFVNYSIFLMDLKNNENLAQTTVDLINKNIATIFGDIIRNAKVLTFKFLNYILLKI